MVDEKELAFWLVKNGWVESAPKALRFVKSAEQGECTEEMMDALSMKVLLEKGSDLFALDDLSKGLPEVHSEEVLELLNRAIADATKMIEHWHAYPSDTNAKFFRVNLRNVNWDME